MLLVRCPGGDGGRALHPILLISSGNEHEPRRPWGSRRYNFYVRFNQSSGNALIVVEPPCRNSREPSQSEASHLPVNDTSYHPCIRVNQDIALTQITMGEVKSFRLSIKWRYDIVDFKGLLECPST